MTSKLEAMAFLNELESAMEESLGQLLATNPFVKELTAGSRDSRLIALYLIEVYHFTRHNPVNQAIVIRNCLDSGIELKKRLLYMKFCLNHALEELGHEYMAFHDLKSFGLEIEESDLPKPLPETQAFIAYLYSAASSGNPLQRLGYSYWAENCYKVFQPIAQVAISRMGLEPKNLSFFIQHGKIDESHAADVEKVISEVVETRSDQLAIRDLLVATVQLTSRILASVHERYLRLCDGKEPEVGFLSKIQV